MSELTLVLTFVSFVDAEEEQDVEEEEDESTDDAVDSFRGVGVGGIKAFLEGFFSATVEISAEGTSAETFQPIRDAQRLRRGHLRGCREAETSSVLSSNSVTEHRALLETALGGMKSHLFIWKI